MFEKAARCLLVGWLFAGSGAVACASQESEHGDYPSTGAAGSGAGAAAPGTGGSGQTPDGGPTAATGGTAGTGGSGLGDPVGQALGSLKEEIKVNQLGWRPKAKKVALLVSPITGYNASSYVPGATFEVRRLVDGEVVASGSTVKVPARREGDQDGIDGASGDLVYWADFSALEEPGHYYLYDPTNDAHSHTFEIWDGIYDELFKHVVRFFYYQRQGIALEAKHAGNWTHGGAYLQDTQAVDLATRSVRRDVTGGWSDAGDPTKYVDFAYAAVSRLLLAAELFPAVQSDSLNIPESGNGIPDLLDEVKWELDWLLRMQNADGGVHNRVTHEKAGCDHYTDPADDRIQRTYTAVTSWATASAAAMWAQAANFAQYDLAYPGYRAKLVEAAEKAWAWLEAHPGMTPASGRDDGGTNPSCGADGSGNAKKDATYRRHAAASLYRATGKAVYDSYYRPMGKQGWDVDGGEALDMWHYAHGPAPSTELVQHLRTELKNYSLWRNHLDYDKTDPWHVTPYRALQGAFWWGYNQTVAMDAASNLVARVYGVDPALNDYFLANAEETIHYFLGRSATGYSYLTNLGDKGAKLRVEKPVMHPFHFWWGAQREEPNLYEGPNSKYGPVPGVLVGGPSWDMNRGWCPNMPSPPEDQPGAKRFIDASASPFSPVFLECEWLSLEPGIYYQAALVVLLSGFVSGAL